MKWLLKAPRKKRNPFLPSASHEWRPLQVTLATAQEAAAFANYLKVQPLIVLIPHVQT